MPEINYSLYNFNGVDLSYAVFTKRSVLPNKCDFLQQLKYKSIEGCVMPEMDMSCWNFKDVNLFACTFQENTLLPKDKDLFQNVNFIELSHASLPKIDLRNYNFDKILLTGIRFHIDSPIDNEHILNLVNYINNCSSRALYPKEMPKGFYVSDAFRNLLNEEAKEIMMKSDNFSKITLEEFFVEKYMSKMCC